MRKILSGLTGLVMVMVLVSVSAYALFTAQVTVSGATIGTGTSGLLINAYVSGEGWLDNDTATASLALEGQELVKPLYPGETDWGHIKLINSSEPGVDMNVQARLTAASGDWNALKDVLEMRVVEYNGDGENDHTLGDATAWRTLAEWNSQDRNLPGNPLEANSEQEFWVEIRMPASAENAAMGKTLTDVQFVITGTQVN